MSIQSYDFPMLRAALHRAAQAELRRLQAQQHAAERDNTRHNMSMRQVAIDLGARVTAEGLKFVTIKDSYFG